MASIGRDDAPDSSNGGCFEQRGSSHGSTMLPLWAGALRPARVMEENA